MEELISTEEKELLTMECSSCAFRCESLKETDELIDIYIDLLFKIVQRHHSLFIISLVLMLKSLFMLDDKNYVLKVCSGISYESNDGSKMDQIIDPTSIACLVRNVYETVGMFNLIYQHSKSKDEKTILYCLWVHSGLQYRQRFAGVATSDQNKKKMEGDIQTIKDLINKIEATSSTDSLMKKIEKKYPNV